ALATLGLGVEFFGVAPQPSLLGRIGLGVGQPTGTPGEIPVGLGLTKDKGCEHSACTNEHRGKGVAASARVRAPRGALHTTETTKGRWPTRFSDKQHSATHKFQ